MPNHKDFDYIRIDDERIDRTCEAYFKWKDLNTYLQDDSHRGINMPDAISEPMGCWCLDLLWNRGTAVGDATDPETGAKVEMKATSRFDGDLSSFGPECTFDDLVLLRFDTKNNLLYVYDLHINSKEFGKFPANHKQTIEEYLHRYKQPHINLEKLFVTSRNLQPDIIFAIRERRILQDNRT